MTLEYDLYWSFRSPYSYLVTPRLVELERDHDVRARVRPVYPIAVRQPDFFTSNDPLWLSYFMRDIHRSAEFLGLPFHWARPDPVAMDFATRTYPREQPHIHRLTHLGVAAAERGRGLAFLDSVSRLIWSGEVIGWHEGDHLARAAQAADLDLAEMDAAVAADPSHFTGVVEANQSAQRDGGHYGVPLMVFEASRSSGRTVSTSSSGGWRGGAWRGGRRRPKFNVTSRPARILLRDDTPRAALSVALRSPSRRMRFMAVRVPNI